MNLPLTLIMFPYLLGNRVRVLQSFCTHNILIDLIYIFVGLEEDTKPAISDKGEDFVEKVGSCLSEQTPPIREPMFEDS